MHELAVTESVVDQVVQRLAGQRVVCVRLEIGKLSGILPDSVRFCFELVTVGTLLEGADLQIAEPPGRAHCRRCDSQFSLDQPILLCSCGSADVRLISGDQLLIQSVKVA